MVIQVSGADTWLTLNNVAVTFQPGNDNSEANAAEHDLNIFRITSHAPDDVEIWVDDERLETERYGRWHWRPRGYAGLYQIRVTTPGNVSKTASIRVLPNKLSFARYQEMLAEISDISVDLLFQLRSPASEKTAFRKRQHRSSALRDYQLIRAIMGQLESVIAQIRRSPHRVLVEHSEQRLLHEIPRVTSDAVPIFGSALALSTPIKNHLHIETIPESWVIQENLLTYDVYENQLLKHFIWRQLLTRISSISDRAGNEIRRREFDKAVKIKQGWEEDESDAIAALKLVLDECQDMSRRCITWGSEAFLHSVSWPAVASWPSQVLQKHPAYSRFYKIYVRFQLELGLILNSERFLTRLAVRKMSELYEIWSVFRITQLLLQILTASGFQVVSDRGFFEVVEDQFQFEIDRLAYIELQKDSMRVRIRYEPLYPSVRDGHRGLVSNAAQQRTPDMSVELWEKGRATRVLIFDAKYRAERSGDSQRYLEDDLSKMSDYLHVIRWKPTDRDQTPQKIISSAYILYPGDVLEYDMNSPEIGALPLVPRSTHLSAVEAVLQRLLTRAGAL